MAIILKTPVAKANLRKILAIKFFRITHQIREGYASLFIKPFSSRLLQISPVFNCRVKDHRLGARFGRRR